MRTKLWILGGMAVVVMGVSAAAAPLTDVIPPPSRPPALASMDAATGSLTTTHLVAAAAMAPPSRPLAMQSGPVIVRSGAPLRPVTRVDYDVPARWDSLPMTDAWTRATRTALRRAPHDLSEIVPRDIATWCPAYASNPPHLREAFWIGMISALAHHESTFNPRAVGGGNQWFGLLQIFPPTADHFGCAATTGAALQDPEANLACAARIMSVTVRRDNAVALHDGRWRGIAADWGPMTEPRKRDDMIAWVRGQDYCTNAGAIRTALLPQSRPWGGTLAAGPGHHDVRLASLSTRNLPPDFARN